MVRFPSDEPARHAAVDLLVSIVTMNLDLPGCCVSRMDACWLAEGPGGFCLHRPCDSSSLFSYCLQGDLSLLAGKGGRGLPAGHIVAYQPSHALQAKFVHTLHLAIADGVAR